MKMRLTLFSVLIIGCFLISCRGEIIVLQQTNVQSTSNTSNQNVTITSSKPQLISAPQQNSSNSTLQTSGVINDEEGYFYWEVSSTNNSILVKTYNENLNSTEILLKKENPVKFIDSFKNYILAKEVNETQQVQDNMVGDSIIAYYVYSVERNNEEVNSENFTEISEESDNLTTEKPIFVVLEKVINASVDSSSFPIPKDYVLTQILEVDEVNSIMYVVMKGLLSQNTVIYKINLLKEQPQLNTFSWFADQGFPVIKGNSRVIVDSANMQLMIQSTEAYSSVIEQTTFYRKNFSELTSEILEKEFLNVIEMESSEFLVFSLNTSESVQEMNGFLYHGYGEQNDSIEEISLTSTSSIKSFDDSYKYSLFVGNDDLVLVEVNIDSKTELDSGYVGRLSDHVKDESLRTSIVNDFYQAVQVFYINQEFHLLTQDKYLVYSNKDSLLVKTHEESITNDSSSQTQIQEQGQNNSVDPLAQNIKLLQFIKSYKKSTN